MNCGSLSIKLRIGRKSGGAAGKAHTNGHAIARSREVVCALSRADGVLRAAVAPIRVLMTKNATNIRYI